jgi:hypothetical protein
MEVKIAVQNVARELEIEVDGDPAEVTAHIEEALRTREGVVSLKDAKGRQVLVPAASIGWVQFGEPEKGRVGFAL